MSEKTAYEHGARELKPLTGPDPHDDFSQKAAENRKPPLGMGLTEKVDVERSETDKSDLRGSGTIRPKSESEGEPKKDQAGESVTGDDGGVVSGNDDGDPTFPLSRKERKGPWRSNKGRSFIRF